MKKILSIFGLILLLLVGCQNVNNGTLDTSSLKKIEMKDLTGDQKENVPITYEASSVKDGLEALPFEMTLPEKLPFEAEPFQPPVINDMNQDGKILTAEFRTFSKDKNENIIFMVRANYPVSDNQVPNAKEVKLKNNVVGKYVGNSISFQLDDVSYDVVYVNKSIPTEQHKEEIIQLANQMIK